MLGKAHNLWCHILESYYLLLLVQLINYWTLSLHAAACTLIVMISNRTATFDLWNFTQVHRLANSFGSQLLCSGNAVHSFELFNQSWLYLWTLVTGLYWVDNGLGDFLRLPTIHTHLGNGGYCLTCGSDRTVSLWNPHRGLMVKTYKGPGGEVFDADA